MQACHESAAASAAGDGPAISVNLSRRQLAQPDLPAVVADVLRASGLPAARLRLELKERVLLGAPSPRAATSRRCSELGVGLALDDFGTGYSSLRDLPVRRGQDRPLVRRPSSAAAAGGHGDRRRDRLAGRGAGHRRDRRGGRDRGAGDAAARARLPARAGLSLRPAGVTRGGSRRAATSSAFGRRRRAASSPSPTGRRRSRSARARVCTGC